MKSFEYHMTTDILFGMVQEAALPDRLKSYGRKILLTYGGGSIKRNGLYDKLRTLLSDFEIFELGGIEPNPGWKQLIEVPLSAKEKALT